MNIRTRLRRLWLGRDLYDRAALTIALSDDCERAGRTAAHEWLRANGLAHLIREANQ